jgi:hypothetical protein
MGFGVLFKRGESSGLAGNDEYLDLMFTNVPIQQMILCSPYMANPQ